jgi:hypothetical protein
VEQHLASGDVTSLARRYSDEIRDDGTQQSHRGAEFLVSAAGSWVTGQVIEASGRHRI